MIWNLEDPMQYHIWSHFIYKNKGQSWNASMLNPLSPRLDVLILSCFQVFSTALVTEVEVFFSNLLIRILDGKEDSWDLKRMYNSKKYVSCFEETSAKFWQQLPTQVLLPGKSHGQRSLGGYSPWGHTESDRPERLTLKLIYGKLP